MTEKAILKDGVVEITDLMTWAGWFETADRVVAHTLCDGAEVSTVFIGLATHYRDGEALWFETLVRGGQWDGHTRRYATLEEAMLGHERMLEFIKEPLR